MKQDFYGMELLVFVLKEVILDKTNVLNVNKMKWSLVINVCAFLIISRLMEDVRNYLKMLTIMGQVLSVVQIFTGSTIVVKIVELIRFGMVKYVNVAAISTWLMVLVQVAHRVWSGMELHAHAQPTPLWWMEAANNADLTQLGMALYVNVWLIIIYLITYV